MRILLIIAGSLLILLALAMFFGGVTAINEIVAGLFLGFGFVNLGLAAIIERLDNRQP